jgi:hypothetical protein
MLVGHVGVGLAAKALEPRMKLGTMLAAALMLDIVFFLLVLCGGEHIIIPRGYGASHPLHFDFPYSHSLLSALFWAVLCSLIWAWWGGRRARRHGAYWDGIGLIGALVLSHWLLDFVVHTPDMPLFPGGVGFGLGLWQHQPAALILELGLVAAGFVAFALRSPLHWGRKLAVGVLVAVVGGFTIEGAYGQAAPPDPSVMALSTLALIGFAVAVAAWADRSKDGRGTRFTG